MKWLALGAAVLSLSLSAIPAGSARAQTIPPGSYLDSCTEISVSSPNASSPTSMLTAKCTSPTREVIQSSIPLPCAGAVENLNGTLRCMTPPAPNLPAGSYLSSCKNIRVDGSLLRATCQGVDQRMFSGGLTDIETSLALPCDGIVSNQGGQMVCGAVPQVDAAFIARKFAPVLHFTSDSDSMGYPMSADRFWRIWTANGSRLSGIAKSDFHQPENTDPATLSSGGAPTYYQYRKFGNQVRISYWWFYGYQPACFAFQGAHYGDWEHITVFLTEDQNRVAAVQYNQHTQMYLRIAGPRDAPCTPYGIGRCQGGRGFESEGDRPVVYVGRVAKGSYHDSASGDQGPESCTYYGDRRNANGPSLNSSLNLVDLDGNAEAWLESDRQRAFIWGPDGISTHPTLAPPTANMKACEGSPTWALANAGCFKSEALAGDDQASEDALKECRHGYDNAGLTCNKGVLPWEWSVYGRLNPGNHYGYGYLVPLTDAGLSRRRGDDSEWDLP